MNLHISLIRADIDTTEIVSYIIFKEFNVNYNIQQRVDWIDAVKGLAIILVVIGHVITRTCYNEWDRIVRFVIYSFHMPLFFLLSGLTFKVGDMRMEEFIINKSRRLLLPAVIFSLISIPFYFGYKAISNDFSNEFLKTYTRSIIEKLLDTIMMTSRSAFSGYWFLPVLFSCEIIFFVFIKYIKKESVIVVLVILLVTLNRGLFLKEIYLPLGIREALLALPFIFSGFKLKDTIARVNVHPGIIWALFIVLISHGVFTDQQLSGMYCSDVGNILWFYLTGFLGSFVITSTVSSDNTLSSSKLLKYLGRNSLYIFGFHYFFLDFWQEFIERINTISIIDNIEIKSILNVVGTILIIALSSILLMIYNKICSVIDQKNSYKR